MIGIREYNKKIVSLKNTRKMTKTMKMVSASKFKRAFKAQSNAQVYSEKLSDLVGRLSAFSNGQHPLMKKKIANHNVLVLLVSSDKGLCGGFNNNLFREVKRWLKEHSHTYTKIDFSFCGKRGFMSFRRHVQVKTHYENITLKPKFEDAIKVSSDITESFTKGEYDEVFLAYNHFHSPMLQVPTIEKILPLDATVLAKNIPKAAGDYAYEPSQQELFNFLVPKFLNFKIFYTLLENAAGEHGARMTAMDKASTNTGDLIDRYTLLRNRARQAAITTELIEIISGAEALK